jgi:hypothetical protein
VSIPVRELKPESHLQVATSIGAGGLFFPNAWPRKLGTSVILEIDLLGGRPPLRVAARVVHSGRGDHGLGVGVEFARPQEDIARFLSTPRAAKA